jgi:hypothetical protein
MTRLDGPYDDEDEEDDSDDDEDEEGDEDEDEDEEGTWYVGSHGWAQPDDSSPAECR